MFHVPEYYHDLSLKLSEVLNNIGVNETIVMKRRKSRLLIETIEVASRIAPYKMSTYNFGSLSEGTTTLGLKSDVDTLLCFSEVVVIQDIDNWQPGLLNLLMVKDENTPPGYCQLQLIRDDLPLPQVHVINEHCVKVRSDKVLLKNTSVKLLYKEEHGPAYTIISAIGERDLDLVPAYSCKFLPKEARQWFHRGANAWPTQEIKNFAKKCICFVVPVGSKISQNEDLEWRISTSLTERSLMFSLNITQIRCFILMKMILKTYLGSPLTSFMCKTVLLYCIENTQPILWIESRLMDCLSHCLQRLYTGLIEGNCPHFIIPGNNLMARKFSLQVKSKLKGKLCHILQINGWALFGIQIDDLGRRLQFKLNTLHYPMQTSPFTDTEISVCIPLTCTLDAARKIMSLHSIILLHLSNHSSEFIQQRLLKQLQMYAKIYRNGNIVEQTAISLLVPPICSTLGTIKASLNLRTNNSVLSEAVKWLHIGFNSDVSSGRLKLASVLYSMGDMVSTEITLKESERKYDLHAVEPACPCKFLLCPYLKIQCVEETYFKDIVFSIRENIAFCVRFTCSEINCIPYELQYEMFRSTWEDLSHRDMLRDYWMDWAAVDCLPYLYFLQYKTYGQLKRLADQQQALHNLIESIATEKNLYHRETALNLLGQCMEKENRLQDALQCFTSSLHIRNRNNAAKIHICKLLANVVNHAQV